jgi:hypothetical protein
VPIAAITNKVQAILSNIDIILYKKFLFTQLKQTPKSAFFNFIFGVSKLNELSK